MAFHLKDVVVALYMAAQYDVNLEKCALLSVCVEARLRRTAPVLTCS